MNDYYNMTISEKLTCFVDGELAPEESGDLFIELAKNPEYQEELRHLVLIKNTFKNSIVSAPPVLKSNVMKRTVYRDSPLAKLTNAVAILISFILSKNALTYAGIGMIALTSVFLLSDVENSKSLSSTIQSQTKVKRNIPEVNSKEILLESNSSNLANNSVESGNLNNELNIVPKHITKNQNNINVQNTSIDNNENFTIDIPKTELNDKITLSDFQQSDYFNVNFPNEKSPNINYKSGLGRFLNNLSFSFKKFDGNSTPNFNIANNSETLFNNMSLALYYNIDYYHSLGIVVGFENFLMDYQKYEGDILYNYRQSYNTQWFGLQYSLTTDLLGESGFRPNFNVLAGATNVGPIFKLGAGITYHVSDYFGITAGIESGWLFYTNSGNFANSTWFNTHKLGYNIGFDIGL